MAYFAQVVDGMVEKIRAVADDSTSESLAALHGGTWIQASYNTRGGVHLQGGTPINKNYPGVGFEWHPEIPGFSPPQPFPSWVLDADTCLYMPPEVMPVDGNIYQWNETQYTQTGQGWIRIDNV